MRQKEVGGKTQPEPGIMEVRRAAEGIEKAAKAMDKLPYLDAATKAELKEIADAGRLGRRKAAEYALKRTR